MNEAYTDVWLVFEGVKMGATIQLNGKKLGQITDQFLRYEFPIGSIVQSTNTLIVTFPVDSMLLFMLDVLIYLDSLDCMGRFMACSGGWDWSPYSDTFDQHGAHTLSKGKLQLNFLNYFPIKLIKALKTTKQPHRQLHTFKLVN